MMIDPIYFLIAMVLMTMTYFQGKHKGKGQPRKFEDLAEETTFCILTSYHSTSELMADELILLVENMENGYRCLYITEDEETINRFVRQGNSFFSKDDRGEYFFGGQEEVARRTSLRKEMRKRGLYNAPF